MLLSHVIITLLLWLHVNVNVTPFDAVPLSAVSLLNRVDPSYMVHHGGAYYKINPNPNPIINP